MRQRMKTPRSFMIGLPDSAVSHALERKLNVNDTADTSPRTSFLNILSQQRRPVPKSVMGSGWSLSSGRPKAGPGGRDDENKETADGATVWISAAHSGTGHGGPARNGVAAGPCGACREARL